MYAAFHWTVVQDLASRFADGRLSTEKVLDSEDEELYEMLTAVRGIGRVSDNYIQIGGGGPDAYLQ